MNITKLLLIAIMALFLSNCKKINDKGFVLSSYIEIAYKDQQANDLLDTGVQNHYVKDSIRVYNLVNGVKKEVYNGNYTLPRNFDIYKDSSLKIYLLHLALETDTTLLQLNASTTDTISCVIDNNDNGKYLRKLWYNGVLKWDDINLRQQITITK